jgi:hypothetical protein
MRLGKDELKTLERPVRVERVDIGEDHVFVRMLSARQRDVFETDAFDANGRAKTENIRARLVAMTLCDENGKPDYEDDEIEEGIAIIGEKPYDLVDPIFRAAQKLNLLRKKDIQELGKD